MQVMTNALFCFVLLSYFFALFCLQDIFTAYKQPFAITYLGASLMVVYLPIAFLKDWFCNLVKRHTSKSGKNAESFSETCALKHSGGETNLDVELQGSFTRKDSDADFSTHAEESPLVPGIKDDPYTSKQERELTNKEIAAYGFYIAPIWFVTEAS